MCHLLSCKVVVNVLQRPTFGIPNDHMFRTFILLKRNLFAPVRLYNQPKTAYIFEQLQNDMLVLCSHFVLGGNGDNVT